MSETKEAYDAKVDKEADDFFRLVSFISIALLITIFGLMIYWQINP